MVNSTDTSTSTAFTRHHVATHWYITDTYSPPPPPKIVDCNGASLYIGAKVIYSHGKYGYLKSGEIKKMTEKSIILDTGYRVSVYKLDKIMIMKK